MLQVFPPVIVLCACAWKAQFRTIIIIIMTFAVGRGVPEAVRLALLRGRAWVSGKWVEAVSKKTFPVLNPANGEIIAEVPDMGSEDTMAAVEAAHKAQHSWAALNCKERSDRLKKWYDTILSHKEELAKIITVETGKVLHESLGEVEYGASFLSWFMEEAKRIEGDILSSPISGRRSLVIRQPVGVAAVITPWNFPVAMITRKVSAALAAGCAVVVKPSEETPFSALALAELSNEAGIPPGLFNVVTASRQSTSEVGAVLTGSDLVHKLSFTGSTIVGKTLMAQCARSLKRLSLELGGNAPLIVFNSANIDQAVAGTVANKFRNTGQTCICTNRILVQRDIHDEYVENLVAAVTRLVQGDPFNKSSQQGTLINENAVQKVESHVTDAVSKGAELLVGGTRNEELGSLFYRPSVAVGVAQDMKMANEETFGPLAAVMSFDEEEEAIAVANATPYGLAGYFYSNDPGQIWRVSEALEVGMVGANETGISSEMVPFGGIKQSGFGREGSKYGIQEYLNMKYVCMGGIRERRL